MPSLAFVSSRHNRSWRRFWRHRFLGRVFGLALSSGVGGFFVGALIGVANWRSPGSTQSWWYWVGFTAPVNGIWMMIFGLLIGLTLFTAVGLGSGRWSASRKARFSQKMTLRLFVPIAGSVAFTSLGAMFYWSIRNGGFTSSAPDLGDLLANTELATLPLASCLFLVLLARASQFKPRRFKKPLQEERLLPLD